MTDPENLEKIAANFPIIHFPVHISRGLRYLNGAPMLVYNSHPAVQYFAKAFIRRRLHYSPIIINQAIYLIKRLGTPLSYSCLHIRRNDLQYSSSFLSSANTLKNIRHLLLPNETIYISTDETEPGFFYAFTEAGYRTIKLRDISQEHFPRKYEGMVEQLICAASRVFIGTSTSTYSSYIFRLRAYLWLDTNLKAKVNLSCHYHDRPELHTCLSSGFISGDSNFFIDTNNEIEIM